jgi:hypothetical protein
MTWSYPFLGLSVAIESIERPVKHQWLTAVRPSGEDLDVYEMAIFVGNMMIKAMDFGCFQCFPLNFQTTPMSMKLNPR